MTRSEAVSQIEKIKSNFEAFVSSVNNLVTQANQLSSSINAINYSSIEHETTISLINANLNKINGDITNVVTACTNAVNNVEKDANEKIKEIVDDYNNSIADDPDATKLNYQTVTGEIILASTELTAPTANGDIEPVNTPPREENVETPVETPIDTTETPTETPTDTGNNSNNYSGDNNSNNNSNNNDNSSGNDSGGNNYYPSEDTNPSADSATSYEEVKDKLDYYLAHSATEKLNSSAIEGWDGYIKTFLETNQLDQYVSSITIEDGVVVCILSNGQQFRFNNVEGIVDLLKKLQSSIMKGSDIVNA